MRFSLQQLLIGVGAIAGILAVLCWHPIFVIALLLSCALPVTVALIEPRARTIVLAAVPAMIGLIFLWMMSFEVSLSGGWGPSTIHYQATMQRGKVFFFRFHYARPSRDWAPWIDGYPDPHSDHWSRWPGFRDEHYWLRAPGLELARSDFLAPMTSRSKVDGVEVLTLSFWLMVATFAIGIAALTWLASRRGKQLHMAVSDSPFAKPPAAPVDNR